MAGLIRRIASWFRRPPDFIIGSPERPYMLRWWLLPRNRWGNIYLHCFLRDDDDRALHDHPWPSLSVVMRGDGIEHLAGGKKRVFRAGDILFRPATHRHRIELVSARVWTLFVTGPRVREWGFWCPKGFVRWQQFVAPSDHGNIGKGCDDG